MPYVRCCVPGCPSRIDGAVPMYRLPRSVPLLTLWLSYLSIVCPEFTGLTPNRLRVRRICKKHFEARFFRNGVRVNQSCPTLFSIDEINTGIPQRPVRIGLHSDHSYCQSYGDHTYAASYNPDASEDIEARLTPLLAEQLSTVGQEQPSDSTFHTRSVKRQRVIGSINTLTPKCRKLYKSFKVMKNTMKRENFTFIERLKKAEDMSEKKSFKSIVESMSRPAQIFMELQSKMCSTKKYGRRFTKEEKMLSLALMKCSPKGYRLLSKLFVLPNKRTLNRVTENFKFDCGINTIFFNALKKKAKKLNKKQKMCSIVFDEVQLTPHLTYQEHLDKIAGFVDVGGEKRPLRYADHALAFMARGVVASWRQPIAYYLCEGTTPTASLMAIIKSVVAAVAECGLEPLALICDQGGTNQRALKNLQQDTRRQQILENEDLDETIVLSGKRLSVIYDPPHLIKGVRNNFITKNMIFEGEVATWQDIVDVYKMDNDVGEVRMLPKLNDECVIPSKIRKMKVSNCTKVLSETVSGMLAYTSKFDCLPGGRKNSTTMKTTSEAVLFFDKLFDSLNASKFGTVVGKMRTPVTPKSSHPTFWKDSIKKLEKIQFKDCDSTAAKRKGGVILKKVPSINNFITTLNSFLRIWVQLKEMGIFKFYTRHLNQDPLENFFGKIRSINFRNVNPDPYTFTKAFKSILMNDLIGFHSSQSNCEDDIGNAVINLQDLFSVEYEEIPNYDLDMSGPSEQPIMYGELVSSSQAAQSLKNEAIKEKIKIHATAYVTGYVCKKILKVTKCKNCKKYLLTNEYSNIHEWINQKEYKLLKGRNLKYPSTYFVRVLNELIYIINNQLDINPHKANIKKNIKTIFHKSVDSDMLGCTEHHDLVQNMFVDIVCRMQIHNWCNTINKLFKGNIINKLPRNMSVPQKLAYEKYLKSRKIKQ